MPKQVTNEDLAVMIKNGFDAASADLSTGLTSVKSELKGDIERLETNIQRIESKVDRALHVEYVNLEVRVKRIEQKIGLNPTA